MDPIRWSYFLLVVGQHHDFVMLPRLGVEQPKSAVALVRKGPSLPGDDITFAVENLCTEKWTLVEGGQFSTLTAACVAIDAMAACRNLSELRVARYLQGSFVTAVHGHSVPINDEAEAQQIPSEDSHPKYQLDKDLGRMSYSPSEKMMVGLTLLEQGVSLDEAAKQSGVSKTGLSRAKLRMDLEKQRSRTRNRNGLLSSKNRVPVDPNDSDHQENGFGNSDK
jgi:hypothetical protein